MGDFRTKVRLFRRVRRDFEEACYIHIDVLRKKLGLSSEEFARAVGRKGRTPMGNSPIHVNLQRVTQLLAVRLLLNQLIQNPAEEKVWLNVPHPDFGGVTPKRFIVEGKAESIIDYLNEIHTGALR